MACNECADYKNDCEMMKTYQVKLGKVLDCATCIKLTDPIDTQVFDLLPMIQAGETITSWELLVDEETDDRRLRYSPEEYTRTHGRKGTVCDVCIPDLENTFRINEIGNVEHTLPADGDTLVYDTASKTYKMFNLKGALADVNKRIDDLSTKIDNFDGDITNLTVELNKQTGRINQLFELVASLSARVDGIEQRLSNIENAIYNWGSDKTTKIPRGNINVTSGGATSNNGIFSRAKDQNEDLNFN